MFSNETQSADPVRAGANTALWVVAGILVAAVAVSLLFRNWQAVAQTPPTVISLDSIRELHAARVLSKSPEKIRFRLALRKHPYIVIGLKKEILRQKLHLRIGVLKKIREIRIYPKFSGGRFSDADAIVLPVGKAGGIRHEYNVVLPDGSYEALRVDFWSGEHFGIAEILGISLHPVELSDLPVWSYVLAMLMAAFILLPGMLLLPLIHRQKVEDGEFLSVFIAYSVLFYVVAYLLWTGLSRWWMPTADAVVLIVVFTGLALCAWGNGRLRYGVVYYVSRLYRQFLVYLALLTVCSFILVQGSNLPLENTWYSTIAGQTRSKTYQAFRAHDAVFHYVNGIAISNHEPFSRYYANRALFYGVEDRGILPGVLYSMLRCLLRNASPALADSFLVYTLAGTCFNLMVLFPVFALLRRYGDSRHLWFFSAAFSLNTFILVNYYLTWFKMAGAAFFLSGLYMMFRAVEKRKDADWGSSGLLLGIGANMHAGSALGIPVFFLWSAWRSLRQTAGLMRAAVGPALLVGVFAAANLPWSVIKKLYFHDQYRLIKEHFLAGYSDPAGLGKSVALFLAKVPFPEQVGHRLARLWDSFRLASVGALLNALQKGEIERFFRSWNRWEFTFTAFVLYPFMLLAAVAAVQQHWRKKGGGSGAFTVVQHRPTAGELAGLSALTLLTIVFVSYGSHAPDITYHQPMGVIVLLYVLMIGKVSQAGTALRTAAGIYLALTAYRMVTFFG